MTVMEDAAEYARSLFTLETLRHIALFVGSACLTTFAMMMAPLSKNDDGEYDYSSAVAVFLAEIVKLFISVIMLTYETWARQSKTPEELDKLPPLIGDYSKVVLYYSIPTLLWFINNNLTFLVLKGISPSMNQAVGQAKVIFTVMLLFVLLGRRFNFQQILSLLILSVALINMADSDASSTASDSDSGNSTSSSDSSSVTYTLPSIVGILLALTTALLGAIAGVYNEKLLKELSSCIHFQNFIAYCYGIGFNLAYVFIDQTSRKIVTGSGFLSGFNSFTWLYVVAQGTMGISVSFMYKYQDNIARTFAVGASTGLTLLLSAPAFGQKITVSAVCSVIVILLSLLAYYDGQASQQAAEAAAKEVKTESSSLLAGKP